MNSVLKIKIFSPFTLHAVNISNFLRKVYCRSLLTQFIQICKFFSIFKCFYIKYDEKSEKFRPSKKSHFLNFCVVTLLCNLLTLALIWDLLIEKKSLYQYILFSITLCRTIFGGVTSACSISDKKLIILFSN